MTTTTLTPGGASPAAPRARWLSRFSPPTLALVGIMLLAAALNLLNIEAIGSGNTYYTAAVKAMLQSPANFFFAAAEPGGSVTVDKPPLGLWLQAVSAFFLGVNGFAVTLPQILAGIVSVPLLYALVRRWFGALAGLVAALVMAITPVSIAVQRSNTMDATLILTLLLAAWAFMRATDTGRLRWLLLGGVLVGLGFNIKMLQAFLPVPAFYALYFFGAHTGWGRKVLHLAATTALLLAVSLAWIIVVDLTPADQRPYVGGSDSNSALELAIGYNGIQRLLGGTGAAGGAAGDSSARPGMPPPPVGMTPPQGMPPLPAGMTPQEAMQMAAGGGMFGGEIGTAGVLRLFTQPLDNEIGWLLPFALFGLALLTFASVPRLPLSTAHKGVVLWGGWLVTEAVFFSVAGFFHAYYLAMLAPPLAALVGIGVLHLWLLYRRRRLLATGLLFAAGAATLVYQAVIAAGYTAALAWLALPAAALLAGTALLLLAQFARRMPRLAAIGLACVVLALTFAPAVWAGMGTLEESANVVLPAAYGGSDARGGAAFPAPLAGDRGGALPGGSVDAGTLAFLQANTRGMRYLLAVGSSMQGTGYVLAAGRGVLYMGGFNGQNPVVDAADLQALVDAGDLRYVLGGGGVPGGAPGGMGMDTGITDWLAQQCSVVRGVTVSGTLYDCAP